MVISFACLSFLLKMTDREKPCRVRGGRKTYATKNMQNANKIIAELDRS